MTPLDNPPTNLDVAMFIDWENMHTFIRGKANISALREVAEGYGRLVLAKAYADWREKFFQPDSVVLYKIGVEPVYVPHASGIKNNVDVKLATDCIDYAYRYPNIGVFILVTGDGDFIHVVSALRPLGRKVIVIAQSNNASSRFGDLVDTLLIYDQDVNPEGPENSVPVVPAKQLKKTPKSVDEVYKIIVDMLKKEDGALLLLTELKQRLVRMYDGFDQNQYGFIKFKALIEVGAKKGHFNLNTAGLRDWVTLPQKDTATGANGLPNELDKLFEEIAALLKTAPQSQILLASVKALLIKKHGGFDESVYGFNKFKELMEEGARQEYFKIGKNDKDIDRIFL